MALAGVVWDKVGRRWLVVAGWRARLTSAFQWNTSAFRMMRSRVTDLGITTRSCCSDQRINTYAGDTPCRRATAATTGSSRRRPRVRGLYASSWMPRSRQTTTSLSEAQPSGRRVCVRSSEQLNGRQTNGAVVIVT